MCVLVLHDALYSILLNICTVILYIIVEPNFNENASYENYRLMFMRIFLFLLLFANNKIDDLLVLACLSTTTQHFSLHASGNRPWDCADLQVLSGQTVNGFYTVNTPGCVATTTVTCTKSVLCDFTTNGGGWTVIQMRQNGNVDFFTNQGFQAYKTGFGTQQEYWIGNDYIYALTNQATRPNQLFVQVADTNAVQYTSNYATFLISPEATFFRPTFGTFTGTTLVDNFVRYQNQPFGTFDRDNDLNTTLNCAVYLQAGWWYNPQCEDIGNLNVPYTPSVDPTQSQVQGIRWQADTGVVRLLSTSMKVRPVNFPTSVTTSIHTGLHTNIHG